MPRVPVTGGDGFIGADFVYYWPQQHPDQRVSMTGDVICDCLRSS